MISEDRLKKAAGEAAQAIADSLPAPKECQHEFSPSFQKQMHRIFRSTKHPIIYRFPKYAACFVLAVIIFSSTLLTFNTEARAAFFAWVREQYEALVEYRFIGDVPTEDEVIEYMLTWLPEGYLEVENHTLAGSSIAIYRGDPNQIIQFSYSQGKDATSLFVTSDYSKITTIELKNTVADFYEAEDKSVANALTWMSEDGEFLFCITAYEPKDVLIKMAESVSKK